MVFNDAQWLSRDKNVTLVHEGISEEVLYERAVEQQLPGVLVVAFFHEKLYGALVLICVTIILRTDVYSCIDA